MILAGGGALWANAGEEIRRLAQLLDAPVITTLNAKGLLDEREPWSLGHGRSARARTALSHADAMLAVGCRFSEVFTDWRRMSIPKSLVQIDLDPEQIGVNYPVTIGIVADARAAVAMLGQALASLPRASSWGPLLAQARAARQAKPEWLIETLREELPDETARLHRRLRNGLSHAGRLAVLWASPVLLPVELHHPRLGLSRGPWRGGGAHRPGRRLGER